MNNQQEQTKSFFKGHAEAWQKKAENSLYTVINDRHRAAHKTLDLYPTGARLLDVGCGTGQLAIEAALKNFVSVGIDFAEEMVTIARKNAADTGSKASFESGSIFDYHPSQKFDVISAMGFIEYISMEQLNELLGFSFDHLCDGGSISIGSRNRLFNVTTYNEYTKIEQKLGTIDKLMQEANIAIISSNIDEYLHNIRSFISDTEFVHNETHPITGIDVQTRYQFTPSDLLEKVEKAGFKVTNIYPVNYHAFNPAVENAEIISIKAEIAELVSVKHQSDFRLLPNSSSFVLEAKKCP